MPLATVWWLTNYNVYIIFFCLKCSEYTLLITVEYSMCNHSLHTCLSGSHKLMVTHSYII